MKLILLLTLISISSSNSFAGLFCSANGLNILYINGVNVNLDANKVTVTNLKDVVAPMRNDLDNNLNGIFKVDGVWNTSRGLFQDIEELKAQLAANHGEQARLEYWRAIAKDNIFVKPAIPGDFASAALYAAERKRIDDALVQITSKPKFIFKSDGTVDQDAYTQSDLYKDLVKYNSALAQLLANAASDLAVVEQLKISIKKAYANGTNKLIVVSHSQGNEVLFSAIKDLRNDRTFLASLSEVEKFDGLVGYMQVAPPSPRLVTNTYNDSNNSEIANYYSDHAQYIRHTSDAVIGSSYAMTGVLPIAANYTALGLKEFDWVTLGLANLFEVWGSQGIGALYHGMDDVYLSGTNLARRDITGVTKPCSV